MHDANFLRGESATFEGSLVARQGMTLLCMTRPVTDIVVETQSDWGYSLGVGDWKGPSGHIGGAFLGCCCLFAFPFLSFSIMFLIFFLFFWVGYCAFHAQPSLQHKSYHHVPGHMPCEQTIQPLLTLCVSA